MVVQGRREMWPDCAAWPAFELFRASANEGGRRRIRVGLCRSNAADLSRFGAEERHQPGRGGKRIRRSSRPTASSHDDMGPTCFYD